MKSVHKCWNRREEDTCVNLFRMTNEDTPGNQVEWMDKNGKIYNSIFTFKEDAPIVKTTGLFERRIICEEKEFNRNVLLTEECLEIHKLMFHGNQNSEERYRPIETNIQGELKYRDKKGNRYPYRESF